MDLHQWCSHCVLPLTPLEQLLSLEPVCVRERERKRERYITVTKKVIARD